MIVNKREIIHHESIVCEYRKVKCHNSVKIEQDVEEMKKKMNGMNWRVEERMKVLNEDIEGIGAREGEVSTFFVQIFEKLRFVENAIQISYAVN